MTSTVPRLLPPLRQFIGRYGKTLSAFGAMQALQLLLPLLALPLLARRLGPESFGLLMYFCLLPPLVALLVDWGTALGGARAAALGRDHLSTLTNLWHAATSARLLLLAAWGVMAAALAPFIPHALTFPGAYALAIGVGMIRGLNPFWFFQGTGRGAKTMALADGFISLLILLLVWLYMRDAESWPLYLLFLLLGRGTLYGLASGWICLHFGCHIHISSGLTFLRATAPLCGSTLAVMVCYNGSQLVLGQFLPPTAMGILVAVNKMLRALGSVINPFTLTLFPDICTRVRSQGAPPGPLLRLSLALTAAASLALTAITVAISPWLISLALGAAFATYGWVLRLGLLAIPFMACNSVLGQQILVPHGHDKALLAVQGGVALAALAMGALMGRWGGLTGGALLPVLCEAATSVGLAVAVWRYCPGVLTAGAEPTP